MLPVILLLLALLCFVLAAASVTVKRVDLIAAGLAAWMLTLVIHAWPG
jgi:hypothetical protein